MLRGTSRLITKRGLVRIAELAGEELEIWSEGWYPAKIWKSGVDRVVRLKLSNGLYFEATPNQFIRFGGEDVQVQDAVGHLLHIAPIASGWDDGDDLGITERDWVALGFFQGDGGFKSDTPAVTVYIGENDEDVKPYFDTDGIWHDVYKYYLGYTHRFVELVERIEMPRVILPERYIAPKVFTAPPSAVRWFLKGLFSANGTVILASGSTGPSRTGRINLKSTCRELIRDVQILLHALGYRTYVVANPKHKAQFRNGIYDCRESYDLNIAGAYGKKFANEIGFIHRYKNEKASVLRAGKAFGLKPIRVVGIEDLGYEDVYEFSEPETQHAWVDGFISRID